MTGSITRGYYDCPAYLKLLSKCGDLSFGCSDMKTASLVADKFFKLGLCIDLNTSECDSPINQCSDD